MLYLNTHHLIKQNNHYHLFKLKRTFTQHINAYIVCGPFIQNPLGICINKYNFVLTLINIIYVVL